MDKNSDHDWKGEGTLLKTHVGYPPWKKISPNAARALSSEVEANRCDLDSFGRRIFFFNICFYEVCRERFQKCIIHRKYFVLEGSTVESTNISIVFWERGYEGESYGLHFLLVDELNA